MKDLYTILGIPETADEDAIKKAYRRLAKENHPDATGGDKKKTERFKEVNDANAVLGDPKKRSEYDRLRRTPMGADGMPQGFDPDMFAQVFGGGGFPPGSRVRMPNQGADLSDLFASLFGGAGGNAGFARGGTARGQDTSASLDLDFRDAALGTRKTIRTSRGETVDVQIPAGVETGARLRVAGHGGAGPRGGAPGDLILDLQIRPDPVLRRNGQDVELELPLTVAEAILGTKVDVPTIDGPVKVSVPAGTSSGARLRLRGRGIKQADGVRGDQICLIAIVVPKIDSDDEETRKLVEDLDKRVRNLHGGVNAAKVRTF